MYQLAHFEQQIVEKIRQLPPEKVSEVESFVDALVQQHQSLLNQRVWEQDIIAMANESAIQAEIAEINAEFSVAEMDGLQKS